LVLVTQYFQSYLSTSNIPNFTFGSEMGNSDQESESRELQTVSLWPSAPQQGGRKDCGREAVVQALPKAGHLWLMTVILATQEAVIRRIRVRSQPQGNSCETLS
jgi:hypothetical protein